MTNFMFYGLLVLIAILWLQAITDIVKTTFRHKIYKIIWICIVVFFPIIGSLIYFHFNRKGIRSKRRKFRLNFNSIRE